MSLKKWWLAALMMLGVMAGRPVYASHNMGVDLSYECLNNCTIRVHLRAYRDCTGITLALNQPTFQGLGAGCTQPTLVGTWTQPVITEVTPVCPGWPTHCNNTNPPPNAINGVEEYYWWADYNICSMNCSTYVISWSDCCRNSAITSGASSAAIYIGSTTINPLVTPCNSSPQFANPPVPYICAGQSFTFNQGAYDPDGDSLSYSLGPCFDSNGLMVGYNAGFSPTAPLGASWNVSIDPITGDVSMVPNPGNVQVGVMCVYVQEWRNGIMIGQVVRDMQITVLSCPNNTVPNISPIQNFSGGLLSSQGNVIYTCVGSTINFNIRGTDADSASQVLKFWWNQFDPGASFVNCNNPAFADTLYGASTCGTFNWTPTATGTYALVFTLNDDACPILGSDQFAISIHVGGLQLSAIQNAPGCGLATLCADPQSGTAPFTYLWQGAGGLSFNPNVHDSCITHNYPNPGTYPYTLTITDSTGCSNTYNDTIVILGPTPNAGPDIFICHNDSGQIGAPAIANYGYSWSPAIGLDNPLSPNPRVSLQNFGLASVNYTYVLTVYDSVTNCFGRDTVIVTVSPLPVASLVVPPTLCENEPGGVWYNGLNYQNASFFWQFSPNANPPSSNTQGPHQVSWSNAGVGYTSVQVIVNGCSSQVATDSTIIKPNPVAAIQPIANQCVNGNSFSFTENGTYNPGATFAWTFAQNATPANSNAQNPSGIVFSSAGNKVATLQITDNGCVSNVATLNFTVYEMPDASWYFEGSPQCLNDNSYCLVANGVWNSNGAVYLWSFPTGTPSGSIVQFPCGIHFSQVGANPVTLSVSENGCVSSYTDTVYVLPHPTADAGPDTSFCEGEGGANLHGSASGGTAPYYYTWWCDSTNTYCGLDSTFDNDPIGNPTATTWYYMQVRDDNGCPSNVDSARIVVLPKPIVDAGPDFTICGDSAPCQQIQASISHAPGPFIYHWLPATGLNNPTILNPCARPQNTTIYTLVAQSLANGCTSDFNTVDSLSSVVVNVADVPIADASAAGPNLHICNGETVTLQGSGYGAGPLYSAQWSPSTGLSSPTSFTPDASPPITTAYVLTVWSNGCPSIGDTVWVNVHTQPTVDAGPDVDLCLGGSVQLDGEAWGDPTSAGYSYFWFPGPYFVGSNTVEDPFVDPPATQRYYVIATSSWGCQSNVDSTLATLKASPVPDAGPDRVYCYGENITFNGSYSFTTTLPPPNPSQIFVTWTPGADLSDSTILNPTTRVFISQVYTLQVQFSTCIYTDDVIVAVLPDIGAMARPDTNVICSGDSVRLNAWGGLGGASYNWIPSNGLSNPVSPAPFASPTGSTVYQVVLSEGGCTDTASIDLGVIPTPQSAFLNTTPSGCGRLDVNFLETSANANNWVWDFGDGSPIVNTQNPTHTFGRPGTYYVKLTSIGPGGCKDVSDPVAITVSDSAVADFTSDPVFPVQMSLPNTQVQFTNLSRNANRYVWDFGDGITSDLFNPEHMYRDSGVFFVKLIAVNDAGCMDEVVYGPYVVVAPDLFIPNIFSPNGDGTNDVFQVIYTGSQPYSLTIHDRWGVPVFQSNNRLAAWDGTVNGGNPASEGVFYYALKIGSRAYTGNITLVR